MFDCFSKNYFEIVCELNVSELYSVSIKVLYKYKTQKFTLLFLHFYSFLIAPYLSCIQSAV